MGNTFHGINALIYISGTELVGGNSWSIQVDPDTVQTIDFGDGWKSTHAGAAGFSGTVNAWDKLDSKLIMDAATSRAAQSFLIYPARGTLTAYYSGSAIFGASSDGSVTSAVSKNGSFTGHGTLTIAGFA